MVLEENGSESLSGVFGPKEFYAYIYEYVRVGHINYKHRVAKSKSLITK